MSRADHGKIGKNEPTKPCAHCGMERAWRPNPKFNPPLLMWMCLSCTPPERKPPPPLADGTPLRFEDPDGAVHVLAAETVYPGSVTFRSPDGHLHIVDRWLRRSQVNGWRLVGRAG